MTYPLRFSTLKLMQLSPSHVRAALDGHGPVFNQSALEKGSAVHSILLGGKRVTTYPGPVRRGKEYERFVADNPDALILNGSDYDAAQRMADAVRANRDAVELLKGQRETTILWDCDGVQCRSTPDAHVYNRVTELKTCKTADPIRFARHALALGYHAQLSFYAFAIQHSFTLPIPPRDQYIVAVESAPPYPVTIMKLTARAMDMGERLWRGWMEQFRACLDSNHWPGYSQSVVDLDVPENLELEFEDAA